MAIELYDYQKDSIKLLKNGSVLCGGVGSGKSMTSLAYYFVNVCKGSIGIDYKPMREPLDLYIITTARKRDTLEWEKECANFSLSTNIDVSQVPVTVDSWNNIKKYDKVYNAFFIFDEQRVVGSGNWVKAFLKIAKNNKWILLSATPGDTWLDYVPVFIANGFFKNRTEFLREHVVYSRFCKYPKIDHYVEQGKLLKLQNQILVPMKYTKPTISHNKNIFVKYDQTLYDKINKERWDIYENKPVKDAGALCYLLRKVTNSDPRRVEAIGKLIKENPKLIIFYNFNYELELLRSLCNKLKVPTTEWNGHKHEAIPPTKKWVYLVQYTAGAEGWNCTLTNTIAFYSQNYSYKIKTQAAGRIDRLNTPFKDLYYMHLISNSPIDVAIMQAIKKKQNFNETSFINKGVKRL